MIQHNKILYIFALSLLPKLSWKRHWVNPSYKREGENLKVKGEWFKYKCNPYGKRDKSVNTLVVLFDSCQVNYGYSTTEYRILHYRNVFGAPRNRFRGKLSNKSLVNWFSFKPITNLCSNAGKRVVLPKLYFNG
jgi:hypothetical protein